MTKVGRPVTVSTVTFPLLDEGAWRTEEDNLELAAGFLREAGKRGSDIVLLPEFWPHLCTREWAARDIRTLASGIPGRITQVVSQLAREFGMYVLSPQYEAADGRLHNSCALLDRDGRVAGVYRKVHLMPWEELVEGLTPGGEIPTFDLDFGRIGITLCFDLYFQELYRILALKGAEVVFLASKAQEPAECLDLLFRARAVDNNLVMVQSNFVDPAPYGAHLGHGRKGWGQVVDAYGRVLADTGIRAGVATAQLDLDERKQSRDVISWPDRVAAGQPDDLRDDLVRCRRPSLYGELVAGRDSERRDPEGPTHG